MALILRRTHHGVTSRTRSTLAAVRLCTRISITARQAVIIGMGTRATHQHILRARIAVIRTAAIRSIRNTQITAGFLSTRTRIADTRTRRTRRFSRAAYKIAALASAAPANIRLCTRIRIVTASPIRFIRI